MAPPRDGRVWPYLFILPAVVVLGLVFVFPLVSVIRNSLHTGSMNRMQFSGLRNFEALLADPVFVTSLTNSLKLLLAVPVTTAVALLIALLLFEGTRGWRLYRVLVFLPYLIPATAIGLSFSFLLQQRGIVNSLLHGVGLGFLAMDWLGDPSWVLPTIGGVLVWAQLGFGVIIFAAALDAVPTELSEAAMVDGATRWQRNRLVLVPAIRGTIEFFLVLQAIQVLAWTFPYVYVISRGGPGTASSVMDLYVWRYAFEYSSPGLSSAAAVVLLALSGVLIVIYSRLRRAQGES